MVNIKVRFYTVLAMIALYSNISLYAQTISAVIPFQGQLTSQSAEPISPAQPLTLVFRLYDGPSSEVALWEEIQPNIVVVNGRFNALLGSRKPFPDLKMFNRTIYLGITVDDGNPVTADIEMRPRQAIVPVISAMSARNSDKLDGHDWSDLLVGGSNDPSTAKVRADRIDLQFDLAQLRNDSGKIGIRPKSIGTDLLASGAVGTDELRDHSVTSSKIAESASVPIGIVMAFAGDELPPGWLWCNGDTLPIDGQYRPLWLVIHDTYGKVADTSKFKLPDYRGKFLRGTDRDGSSVDKDRLDKHDGLGTDQLDELALHHHEAGRTKVGEICTGCEHFDAMVDALHPDAKSVQWTKAAGGNTQTADSGGFETRPKNVAVNWIIKY